MHLERYGGEIWPIKYSIRNAIRVVELDYKLQGRTDESQIQYGKKWTLSR